MQLKAQRARRYEDRRLQERDRLRAALEVALAALAPGSTQRMREAARHHAYVALTETKPPSNRPSRSAASAVLSPRQP